MVYKDKVKVLFRKVTDDVKKEKGLKFIFIRTELGLTKGAFDSMRRGTSMPPNDVMDKLKNLYPVIYERNLENNQVEESAVPYQSVDIERLKISNKMLQEIVDLQRKNIDLMERELQRLTEIINNHKIKI